MNAIINGLLAIAGVPEDLVAAAEQEVPGAQRLIAAARKIQPDLLLLEPLVKQAQPIIARVIPVLLAEQADFFAALPVAQKVLAFVQSQKGS